MRSGLEVAPCRKGPVPTSCPPRPRRRHGRAAASASRWRKKALGSSSRISSVGVVEHLDARHLARLCRRCSPRRPRCPRAGSRSGELHRRVQQPLEVALHVARRQRHAVVEGDAAAQVEAVAARRGVRLPALGEVRHQHAIVQPQQAGEDAGAHLHQLVVHGEERIQPAAGRGQGRLVDARAQRAARRAAAGAGSGTPPPPGSPPRAPADPPCGSARRRCG